MDRTVYIYICNILNFHFKLLLEFLETLKLFI